jgi:hypothetical protein
VPLPVPTGWQTFDYGSPASAVVPGCVRRVHGASAFQGCANVQRVLVGLRERCAWAGTSARHRQVALGCLMLTVGGLLARSAWRVGRWMSVQRRHQISGASFYRSATGMAGDLHQQLQANLAARSDVESVALGWHAPVSPVRTTARFTTLGSSDVLQARYNVVSPDYFRTLGVGVLAGREFDSRDRREAEAAAIVNDVLAARFEGGATGQTLQASTIALP